MKKILIITDNHDYSSINVMRWLKCAFLHQYCDFVYRDYNELLQLPNYCFCSRATTLSVGLALKCDETEASRSENTL